MSWLTISTFQIDVTCPPTMYLCGGFHPQARGNESPLYLRGVILSDGGQAVVLASINYTYLSGRSQRRLVEALARGAEVPASHVALHSDHVHAAPLIDEEHHLLVERETGVRMHDEGYFSDVCTRAQSAAAQARRETGINISGVAFSEHPVDQFASSRRVLDADGRCQIRWSVCRDLAVRNAPQGRIDPMLSQIVFFDESNKPVTAMSFYASHPQVSDSRLLISSDTVGVALDLFTANFPQTFPIYFSGCAGDITAGKYSTTDLARNRLVFGVRLYDAMRFAFEAARPSDIDSIGWADETFDLPLAPVPENEAFCLGIIRDPSKPPREKYQAAMRVLRLREHPISYPFRINRLRLGNVNALFLPTELVVDYQLYARSIANGPLAVAAYGDSYLKYVATAEMFPQGGYEVSPTWTEVGPDAEAPIKTHIESILKRKI